MPRFTESAAAASTNALTDHQTQYVLDDSVRSALPPKE